MTNKIRYEPNGHVVLGNQEWNWDTLKEICYSDFVYEAKPRGTIVNKFKLPKDILNRWIEFEGWETAKKSHWQRPFSYRIDSDLTGLLQNLSKLLEIQKEVNDIDFHPENLLSKVTLNVEIKDGNHFKKLKTIVFEKYKVIIKDEPDEYGYKAFKDTEEIRYKTEQTEEQVIVKFSKPAKKRNP
jgi:hypothetical protein